MRAPPRKHHHRLVERRDRDGRVAQRIGVGVVRPHLVTGRSVVGERQADRRRAPAAVLAVVERLPLADAVLDLLLERLRRVAQVEERQDHLRGRHGAVLVGELGSEHRRVVGDQGNVDGCAHEWRRGRCGDGGGLGRRLHRRTWAGAGGRRHDHRRQGRSLRRGVDERLDPADEAIEPVADAEHVDPDGAEAGGEEEDEGEGGEAEPALRPPRESGAHRNRLRMTVG
jgi:hypothetical protein